MLEQKSDYEFVNVDNVDIQGNILPLASNSHQPIRSEDLAYLTEMRAFFDSSGTSSKTTISPIMKLSPFYNLISAAKGSTYTTVKRLAGNLPIYTFPITTSNYPYDIYDYLCDTYGINYLAEDYTQSSRKPMTAQMLLDLYAIFNQRYYKQVYNRATCATSVDDRFTFLSQEQNATATHSYRSTDASYHDIVLTTDVTFDASACTRMGNTGMTYPYGRRAYHPFSFGCYPCWHNNKTEYLWYRNGLNANVDVVFDMHRTDVEDAYLFMWYCANLQNGYRYQFKQSRMTKVGSTTWSGRLFDLDLVTQYAVDQAGFDASKIGTYTETQGNGASIEVIFSCIYAKYNSKFYYNAPA